MSDIQILEPEITYMDKPKDEFVDIHGHRKWMKNLIVKNGEINPRAPHFMLLGPPGVGKSLMVQWVIQDVQKEIGTKIPYFTLEASEDTREYHLKGSYVLAGDKTPFVLGKLAAAVHTAINQGISLLNIEEIGSLVPGVQKILNGLLDQRRCLDIPEAGIFLQLPPGHQVIVVSSLNPVVYGGVNALNADLISRLAGRIVFDYPTIDQEIKILCTITKASKKLVQSLIRVAQLTRVKSLSYQIGTRDLRSAIEIFQDSGDESKMLLSLAAPFHGSESEYKLLIDRINACFDVDLTIGRDQYDVEVDAYRF